CPGALKKTVRFIKGVTVNQRYFSVTKRSEGFPNGISTPDGYAGTDYRRPVPSGLRTDLHLSDDIVTELIAQLNQASPILSQLPLVDFRALVDENQSQPVVGGIRRGAIPVPAEQIDHVEFHLSPGSGNQSGDGKQPLEPGDESVVLQVHEGNGLPVYPAGNVAKGSSGQGFCVQDHRFSRVGGTNDPLVLRNDPQQIDRQVILNPFDAQHVAGL